LRIKDSRPPLICRPDNSLAISDEKKGDILARGTIRSIQTSSNFQTCTTNVDSYGFSSINFAYGFPCKTNFPSGDIRHYKKKLQKNKYQGHDLISNRVVKNLPKKMIVHLSYIYKAALRLSSFLTIWKSSVIITVLKYGKHPENP